MERRIQSGSFDQSVIGPQLKKEHKILVGIMFIHRVLKHSFNDFIDNFNLSIALGVIRRWILVFKTKQ